MGLFTVGIEGGGQFQLKSKMALAETRWRKLCPVPSPPVLVNESNCGLIPLSRDIVGPEDHSFDELTFVLHNWPYSFRFRASPLMQSE